MGRCLTGDRTRYDKEEGAQSYEDPHDSNLVGVNALKSSDGLSPSINWRTSWPVSPARRIPFLPWPVAYQRPESWGSAPIIGKPSGVIGRSPAQVRRTLARI